MIEITIVEATPEVPELRILKKEFCSSISGRSTLTYHIGIDSSEIVQLRIFSNTGKGVWSRGWILMSAIQELLAEASEERPLTSASLHMLFAGTSINTSAFLVAVLKNEGLISAVPGRLTSYRRVESNTFDADIQVLIDAGVSLDALPIVKPVKSSRSKREV